MLKLGNTLVTETRSVGKMTVTQTKTKTKEIYFFQCQDFAKSAIGIENGTVGLVYMMLKAVQQVEALSGVKKIMNALEKTVLMLMDTVKE